MMEHIDPRKSDVKLGRGGRNFLHHGNVRLRNEATRLAPTYGVATKMEKANMIDNVLERLFEEDPPVRFLHLKRPLGGIQYWEEANRNSSRGKVSQDLRDAVRRMRHQERNAASMILNYAPK